MFEVKELEVVKVSREVAQEAFKNRTEQINKNNEFVAESLEELKVMLIKQDARIEMMEMLLKGLPDELFKK